MNVIQCRMARAAREWSANQFAKPAGIAPRTVANFEAGANCLPETVEAMRAAFVREGIAFTNGSKRAGVSYLRKD